MRQTHMHGSMNIYSNRSAGIHTAEQRLARHLHGARGGLGDKREVLREEVEGKDREETRLKATW